MKKTTLAILFAASCISSSALAANSGNFYIQGDLLSSALYSSEADGYTDATFGQRLSLGYALDSAPVRIAADLTNYGSFSDSECYGVGCVEAKLKVTSFGVSAFYDFKNFEKFVPYIGARVAYTHAKAEASAVAHGESYYGEGSTTGMGLGLIGGFQYNFTKQFYLNASLEGSRLWSDVGAGSAQIGLGYRF
ncbi:opacity family porin [Avibacterium avium]|uniref:opacity family porin n=1 Tax=Avibacterium avium TaxID=751 RepID=UPI003BF7FA6F